MATKNKQSKPNNEEKNIDASDSSPESSDNDDDNNDEKYIGNEVNLLWAFGGNTKYKFYKHEFHHFQVIQVEFEGRNPITGDFHGIRQLLQQLFLKSEINLSELSDIITGNVRSLTMYNQI